jgi:hypothetical protein
MQMPPGPDDRGAVARRDAGLRRVSRLTRWLLAGALAATAAFSAIAARTLPGNSSSQASNSTSTTTERSSQTGTSGDDGSTTLQAPSSSPSASGGAGSVTSGGS